MHKEQRDSERHSIARGQRNPPPFVRKFSLTLNRPDSSITQAHAQLVRNVLSGQDTVDQQEHHPVKSACAKNTARFESTDLIFAKSWFRNKRSKEKMNET